MFLARGKQQHVDSARVVTILSIMAPVIMRPPTFSSAKAASDFIPPGLPWLEETWVSAMSGTSRASPPADEMLSLTNSM